MTTDAARGLAVTVEDRVLPGPHGDLPVRVYTPARPSGTGLVWAHGGGFAAGDLDMPEADWVARAFAERGILVVSVDYRLAPLPPAWAAAQGGVARPGVHYPVASEEISFAFAWAAASDLAGTCAPDAVPNSGGMPDSGPSGENRPDLGTDPEPGTAGTMWAIGGASAGANLVAGATLRLMRDGGPVPAHVALAYPTLHAVQPAPDAALRAALDANPGADRFGPDAVRGMYENYLGGPVDDAGIFAVPGLATASEVTGFPATTMINGDTDELRVSGEAFAATLTAAGVDVDVSLEPGTEHGHLNRPDEAAASLSLDRFAGRLLALAPTL